MIALNSFKSLVAELEIKGLNLEELDTSVQILSRLRNPVAHPDHIKSAQLQEAINTIICKGVFKALHETIKKAV
jgi:hypothetical protein